MRIKIKVKIINKEQEECLKEYSERWSILDTLKGLNNPSIDSKLKAPINRSTWNIVLTIYNQRPGQKSYIWHSKYPYLTNKTNSYDKLNQTKEKLH